jgi:hypothetical protein
MKGLRLYLIIGGAIFVIYLVAQFNRPRAIDWSETLSSKDKIPFGTYVLKDRLNDIFPHARLVPYHEPIYNVLVDDTLENSSYIIVCPQIEVSKYDYKRLTDYLSDGNDVFIAAEAFGGEIAKKLDLETKVYFGILGKLKQPINFVSPHLDSATYYTVDKEATNVAFSGFDTARAMVLGKNSDNKANFIRYRFGKGNLYLAANPKMFSNYSLLTDDGAKYAAIALSYIKNTSDIAWDDYYTQGETDESPMHVFLTNPYLQWAYYITIFSLLLFVLYEIKRRQRIIPVIKPLANSTLEFVNVIGQLYYEKRNNANIAHKQVMYLLAYLRDEYQLKTGKIDDEFIGKLKGKVGLDDDFAEKFASYLQFISVQERVSDNELINLNKLIEQFYIKSR